MVSLTASGSGSANARCSRPLCTADRLYRQVSVTMAKPPMVAEMVSADRSDETARRWPWRRLRKPASFHARHPDPPLPRAIDLALLTPGVLLRDAHFGLVRALPLADVLPQSRPRRSAHPASRMPSMNLATAPIFGPGRPLLRRPCRIAHTRAPRVQAANAPQNLRATPPICRRRTRIPVEAPPADPKWQA
jgi:hypothetical protein